jgi:tripartite-type tricarboxylate transporter receptor subunit TctC
MKKSALVLAALGSMLLTAGAFAQEWPTRPIKLIVPTGPGTGTDIMARVMANEVSKNLKGSVFVENLPGASGIPAHRAAATAAPDGYTFLFTNTSGIALNPVAFKSLPYDPAKDFMAVAMVADLAPQLVSVHKDLQVKSLPELIAYAEANPGKLDYAVDVTAGAAPFSARLLNGRSGAKMIEVPYRSAAQMTQDVAAGRVPVLITSIAASRAFLDNGNIRAIAVFSSRRFPTLLNVPTVAETLPNTVLDGFFAVVAPVGTPKDIVLKFNRAVGEFLKTEEAPKRLADLGLGTSGTGTPESTAKYIADEQHSWRELAKELKIEPQ